MWTLLTAAALAAMPPDVDLDDVPRWERAAEQLVDGPRGCWELVGKASWDWDIGRFGGSAGDAAFLGRLDNGVWSSVHLEPLGELVREAKRLEVRVYAREARFAPLVGKLVGSRVTIQDVDGKTVEGGVLDQNAEATNVLRRAMDRISAEAETSWVVWDDVRQGVVLHRAVALSEGRTPPEAEVTVFFPGGRALPTELDVAFPERFFEGRLPAWRISDAEVHIRGQISGDRVYPATESFKFGFGVLGFRFSGAQTIRYTRATRCPSEVAPPVAPVEPAEGAAAEGAVGAE